MEYRIESDSIGEKKVPLNAYYGVQTLRAKENFKITNQKLPYYFIITIAQLKKAAAITNIESGQLDRKIGNAIIQACDEIINNKFHDQFIVDPIQGGAGTSTNMNANEVIANIALELLGYPKGRYDIINPNDDVNMSQSTNDVYPTCGKITAIKMIYELQKAVENLYESFIEKSIKFKDYIKMGRTQLEDAVPITLGQEFEAYAESTKRSFELLKLALQELHFVNLGGTAVGTGINADIFYVNNIVNNLSEATNIKLIQSKNLIDATQNLDVFVLVSGIIKTCAVNLSKISNDLRLLNSGPRTGLGEINLPSKQNGSSIMPGKVNPVIPEVVNQIAFNIIGNDTTITLAVEGGQLELNAFEPVLFYNLFESITTLTNGINTFNENCIKDITANKEVLRNLVDYSIGLITAVNPYIGYKKSAEIAKEALATGKSIKELLLSHNLLSEDKINEILDPYLMLKPSVIKNKKIRR